MTRALLCVLGLTACTAQPAPEPLPHGDATTFAASVQPVLDARCAEPSCHGRPERPLSIYSPLHYRRDPARRYLAEPLSPEEQTANLRVVLAFVLAEREGDGSAASCLVACKPLAASAGGCGHQGGEIFPSADDRDYRALETWLTRTLEAP